MIKLTVANQRGGVGKTTTTLTLARCMANAGKKVLVVDTDPQGSVKLVLKLQCTGWLHELLDNQRPLSEVITKSSYGVDFICSDRRTQRAEAILATQVAREMIFYTLLAPAERQYDVMIFDVSPAVSALQSCSIAYTKNTLIPVSMDSLAIEGAMASVLTTQLLNQMLHLDCRCVGFLPTAIDRRTSATEVVMDTLKTLSDRHHVPLLGGIRTDQAVNKAMRSNRFLADFDPKSRALEDYQSLADSLMEVLETNVEAKQQAS